MTIPNVGDTVEIAIEAEFDDTEDVVNVFDFYLSGGTYTTQTQWETDLLALVNALIAIAKNYGHALTIWKRYRARNRTQGTPTEQFELATSVGGVGGGDALPSACSVLMGFRTPEPRRVLRKYFGVPSEGMNNTDAKWSSTVLANGAADIATLLTPWAVTNGTWWYCHWKEPVGPAIFPSSGYVSSEPAYQRRRRRGRGS